MDEKDDQGDVRDNGVEEGPVTSLSYHDEHGKIVVRPKEYKTIAVDHADVVVLRRFPGITVEHVDWLIDEFNKRGMRDVIVCVVDKKSDLTKLDERQMSRYGWYRSKQEGTTDVEPDKE